MKTWRCVLPVIFLSLLGGCQSEGDAALREELTALRAEVQALKELCADLRQRLEAKRAPAGGTAAAAVLRQEVDELRRQLEEVRQLAAAAGREEPVATAELAAPAVEEAGLQPGLVAEIFSYAEDGDWLQLEFAPEQLVLARVDPRIDFHWGEAPPGPEPELDADNFAIRWSGYLRFPADGEYELATYTDDGARLYLNGERLINDWRLHGLEDHRCRVRVKAGLYPLRLEYFESGGGADCLLCWLPPGAEDTTPIPAEFLSHRPGEVVIPPPPADDDRL